MRKKSTNSESNLYYEENIFIEGYGLLRYSLSNNLEIIKEAMINRFGIDDFNFIDTFGWSENHNLSESVKNAMNKYNVNYSMTYSQKDNENFLVINKRENNRWFITGFEEPVMQNQENYAANFTYNEPKKQKSSSGFGTAFSAGLLGSLSGNLIRSILDAGGTYNKKRR